MNKSGIINKLLIDYDVWECGYSRNQLEALTKNELLLWLKKLKDE